MTAKRVVPRPSYPPVPPFTWPEPGKPTWTAPEKSYFGGCTGAPSCSTGSACPVGVIKTLSGGPHGCDCPCHQTGTISTT